MSDVNETLPEVQQDAAFNPASANSATTEVKTEPQIQIQIEDILNATKIIEAAMERNVFKARELVEVSAVFQRLLAFSDAYHASQDKTKGE